MGGINVFDRLAAQLSPDERNQLLTTIRSSMEQDLAPVNAPDEGRPHSIVDQIQALGFFGRARLFLAQIFTGSDRETVITNWSLATIRKNIPRSLSGAIDVRRGVFREEFARSLVDLRHAFGGAAPILERISSDRVELVFLLAADQFPVINQDLLRRTSEEYLEQQKDENERTLKRTMTTFLDDRLADIPTQSAARIRRALEQADQLSRLGMFSFSSMLGAFSGSAEGRDRQCAFDYVVQSLERLVTDVSGLSGPLEHVVLENVILLACRRADTESPEDYQQRIVSAMATLTGALRVLRAFVEQYPLVSLVRLAREDPWWEPQPETTKGNEWLKLYREKLAERITREVLRVTLNRQVRGQVTLLEGIIGADATPFKGLPNRSAPVWIHHWYLALVLRSFATSLWRPTMSPLRQILNGADFYKSSNRAQYNDAFNEYEQIPQKIRELERMLQTDGDWGGVLHGDEDVDRRWEMASRLDQELEQIVSSAQTTLDTMANLLGGILYSRPGSSYDTIANYGQIGGRRNAELIEEIKEIHSALQRLTGIVGEVGALEQRARENGMFLRPSV